MIVLILIVVEDGLVLIYDYANNNSFCVLILIVVEDGLVQISDRKEQKTVKGS